MTTVRLNCSFSRIYVIESLDEGYTGRQLYDDYLKDLEYRHEWLEVEYKPVCDIAEFARVLDQVATTFIKDEKVPLLHLEAHGSENGLHLKSGECLEYGRLAESLRRINLLTCDSLFISIAACKSMYSAQRFLGTFLEPTPFCGLLGSFVDMTSGEMMDAFKAFYEELFVSSDAYRSLVRAREACPEVGKEFTLYPSEYLFLIACKNYYITECTEAKIDERIDRMIQSGHRGQLAHLSDEEFRKTLRTKLGSDGQKRESFEKAKKRFFMHDQCPANLERFSPTYDEMLRAE